MTFPPAWLRRILASLDRLQQRFRASAFAVAVLKRYGDDRGGMYAALITFYGLVSLFPLLLLLITAASRILGPNSAATERLINSALAEFPIIGSKLQLKDNIHALSRGNTLATVVSALFLLWGALGVAAILQTASHEVWGLPRHEEPNLLVRTGRSLQIIGIIAIPVIVTSASAGLAASGYLQQFSRALGPALIATNLAVNLGGYWLALKVLSPGGTRWAEVVPGAVVGGAGWTILQQLGGYLISHQLSRTQEIYGFFAIVLGLIFWINLGARLFIYATEINVVRRTRGWPRGLFEPSRQAVAAKEAAQASSEN